MHSDPGISRFLPLFIHYISISESLVSKQVPSDPQAPLGTNVGRLQPPGDSAFAAVTEEPCQAALGACGTLPRLEQLLRNFSRF